MLPRIIFVGSPDNLFHFIDAVCAHRLRIKISENGVIEHQVIGGISLNQRVQLSDRFHTVTELTLSGAVCQLVVFVTRFHIGHPRISLYRMDLHVDTNPGKVIFDYFQEA